MKNLQKKLKNAKATIKEKASSKIEVSAVEYFGLSAALGVSAGAAVGLTALLVNREYLSRQVFQHLKDGNVVERVYEDGSKLVVKILKAGEEACACELH